MCHLLPSDSYKGEELWVSFYINVLRGYLPLQKGGTLGQHIYQCLKERY